MEKYHTYDPLPAFGERQRIDLTKNFRSRVQVVEAVNGVFSRLMNEQTGGLAYDDRAALYPGAVYPENTGNESELLLVDKPRGDAALNARQAEARAIAAKIKELRAGFTVTDRASGGLRPAEYSDMVILLRATSGWDEEFKAVLEEEGIPVYITSRTGYFGATEVQELLQLLRVLDNPRQDIPLFGVMKSVFGGFTEEEIALIKSGSRKGSLYEAAERFAADGTVEAVVTEEAKEAPRAAEEAKEAPEAAEGAEEIPKAAEEDAEYREYGELRDRMAAFLQRIEEYRRCTVYMPVRELLTKLITDFDYLNYVTALPAGGKRRANVEMLLTRASDFEKTSYFGLFHFVRYMEQLEKYDVDYGEAELLDENANVVRIMSIHKSKGLEFPVTFVAGLGKRFNMQDVNRSLILDMDLGLATDYVNPGKRMKNKTLRRNVLARKSREESLAEELRVFYVAMTRAREKLILTASMENAAEKWEVFKASGSESLLYPDFIESGSYLDFLMPIVGSTCIRITVLEEEEFAAESLKEQLELGDRVRRLERAGDFADKEALERLRRRLDDRYPFENLAGLYTKTTVSELKIAAMADRDEAAYHTFEEKEIQPYIPTFRRQEEKVSGTVRGNAYHRVMELLDFGRILRQEASGEKENTEDFENYRAYRNGQNPVHTAKQLRTFLKEEVESRRLKEEYAQAVNEKKYSVFWSRNWRTACGGRREAAGFIANSPLSWGSARLSWGRSFRIRRVC